MLASGDLRLVALYFIEQQPRHGYDLIKAIEEKTGGMYSPSPGVIYPALTFLEEAGYVTSVAEANKRLYTITEEGRPTSTTTARRWSRRWLISAASASSSAGCAELGRGAARLQRARRRGPTATWTTWRPR